MTIEIKESLIPETINPKTRLRLLPFFIYLSEFALGEIERQIKEAEESGYAGGYSDGYDKGFEESEKQIVAEIGEVDDTDWKRGYDNGYKKGFEDCRQDFIDGKITIPIHDAVREDFIKEGYDKGYKDCKNAYIDEGFVKGYDEGYEKCKQDLIDGKLGSSVGPMQDQFNQGYKEGFKDAREKYYVTWKRQMDKEEIQP